MPAAPPRVHAIFAAAPGYRVAVRLTDGTHRITLPVVLDMMGVAEGSPWVPEYDKSPLVLKMGDPGFA